MYGSFNANDYQPSNGGGNSHPVGIFAVTVSNAEIVPTKNNDGGMYAVTFKSDKGEITNRYNLWNSSEQTVDIARRQLSALCHAIQFYNINFDADGGRSLIGAPLMIEVGPQMVNSDPNDKRSAKIESPNLREIKKVFTKEGINPANPQAAPVVPAEGGSSAPAAGPASSPPGAAGPSWGAQSPPAAQTPPQAAPAASPPPAANGAAPAWAGGTPAAAPVAAPAAGAPPWAR